MDNSERPLKPQAWFFQANPDRYDIVQALETLDQIAWRTPQHAWEIRPGDLVVIWRSGKEAGVVGVGRVQGFPRGSASFPEETVFALDTENETGVATRTPIAVAPVELISKEQIASLASFSSHQIITAPLGTVFSIASDEWVELKTRFPSLAKAETIPFSPADDEIPKVFAWQDRKKSVYPLPGGIDDYLKNLSDILDRVADLRPARSDLEGWLQDHFSVTEANARYLLLFLMRLGILREQAGHVEPTSEGTRFLATADRDFLVALLHARVRFIGELLELTQKTHSIDELLQEANRRYDLGWSTRAQIDRRVGWLRAAGTLKIDEEGRLSLTEGGQAILSRVKIFEPQEPKQAPSEAIPQAEVSRPTAPSVQISPRVAEAEKIGRTLIEAARQSQNSAGFERAVGTAFGFLGFISETLGGPGKTDVLLIAPLGPEYGYRVIVECKTTAKGGVRDQQIDWMTLRDHRKLHKADHIVVVAPSFEGAQVFKRAKEDDVKAVLVEAPKLAEILRQHADLPLGLESYRQLFLANEFEEGAAEIAELAEEAHRWVHLASAILGQITELQDTEASLSARDLYWILRHLDEEGEGYTVEEIQVVLDSLASPVLAILRKVGSGYLSIGSLKSASEKLKVLAQIVAPPEN